VALRKKQRAFIEHYLQCWNASEAARRAGYSERTAASIGHENLTKPEIAAAIQARLDELKMSADEVLLRLSEHARASIEDFVTIDEQSGEACLDLARAEAAGTLHLIKKLWQDKDGRWRVELVDSQAALALLGKHHLLFIERTFQSQVGEDFDLEEWRRKRQQRLAAVEAMDEAMVEAVEEE
jgi:hypothetical protein